jgi:hypothetical protein
MDDFEIPDTYTEIEYELWALGHMLGIIEPAIAKIAADDKAETLADLKANRRDQDASAVQFALDEVRERRDAVLPRFMRGPFIVALWACFEFGVQMVAAGVQHANNIPIALCELRGESFLKRAERYFDALLNVKVDKDSDRLTRLADMYRIRCALAHSNGSRSGVSKKEWVRLCEALRRLNLQPDEQRGFVILTEHYVRTAFDDVNGSLVALVAQARLVELLLKSSRTGEGCCGPPGQAALAGEEGVLTTNTTGEH